MNALDLVERERTLVGQPAEVANVLRANRTAGRLVSATYPRPVDPTDPAGPVWCQVVLLEPSQERRKPTGTRSHRPAVIGAGVTGGAGVLVGLGWLVWTHLATVLGALVVVVVIAVLVLRSRARSGGESAGQRQHCPGCFGGR